MLRRYAAHVLRYASPLGSIPQDVEVPRSTWMCESGLAYDKNQPTLSYEL
jgi:hypothetical protein